MTRSSNCAISAWKECFSIVDIKWGRDCTRRGRGCSMGSCTPPGLCGKVTLPPSTFPTLHYLRPMGRQWLQAKREVAGLKKGQVVGKLVKEIMVAAKLGGPDPDGNARLFAAIEKSRRASVSR